MNLLESGLCLCHLSGWLMVFIEGVWNHVERRGDPEELVEADVRRAVCDGLVKIDVALVVPAPCDAQVPLADTGRVITLSHEHPRHGQATWVDERLVLGRKEYASFEPCTLTIPAGHNTIPRRRANC